MITKKLLKETLHYDQNTGIFTWLISKRGVKKGSIAGSFDAYGYRRILINAKVYKAHRLAWLYSHGYFPENQIDHINRIKDDNRLKNLREVTQQCNNRNTGNHCTNISGVKGVSWDKTRNKWKSTIQIDRKSIWLGRFEDFLEAVCHRLAAEQDEGWAGCDSSSPAYRYVKESYRHT